MQKYRWANFQESNQSLLFFKFHLDRRMKVDGIMPPFLLNYRKKNLKQCEYMKKYS